MVNPIATLRSVVSFAKFETNPVERRLTARWIEPVEAIGTPAAHRPAYHLATDFTVTAPPVSAHLFATAHGVYEVSSMASASGTSSSLPASAHIADDCRCTGST
jgi:hypothetical protein